jgi:hypothetical protein
MTTFKDQSGNGRPRPTLADQLDRLDRILDGLGEALTDAVAQAVREALTSTLMAGIRPPASSATGRGPSLLAKAASAGRVLTARAGRCFQQMTAWAAGRCKRFVGTVAGRAAKAAAVRGLCDRLAPRRPSATWVGILSAALAGSFAGPLATSVGCGGVGATVLLARWATDRSESARKGQMLPDGDPSPGEGRPSSEAED